MMQYKLQASSSAEQTMSTSCLGRAAVPARRVWRGVTVHLGLIRRGTTGKPSSNYVPMKVEAEMDAPDAWLGGLRKEVRTCEYGDVHVMWEMLSNTTAGGRDMPDEDIIAAATGKQATVTRQRARRGRKPVAWSRLVYYCCAL